MVIEERIPSNENFLAIDTETTGLSIWKGCKPFAFSFCTEHGRQGFIRFPVDPFTREVIYDSSEEDKANYLAIKKFFENPEHSIVGHNIKFDIRMLEGIGINVKCKVIHDTMFMMHMFNNLEPTFALKPLSKKYLDIDETDKDELKKSVIRARHEGKKLGYKINEAVEADYWLGDAGLLRVYACMDVERTMLLYILLKNDLVQDTDQWLAYKREIELFWITYNMEKKGVMVDVNKIKEEIAARTSRVNRINEVWNALGHRDFNHRSSVQISELLYRKLAQPIYYRTDSGNPSTDSEALGAMDCEEAKVILQLRSDEKTISMLENYNDLQSDGIIHCDYQQLGPVTGRFACRTPNLQNTAHADTSKASNPIETRQVYRPRPGYVWIHFDYDQLEGRIFAQFAKEQTMIEAFLSGRDLHTECANKVWGGETDLCIETAMKTVGMGFEKTKESLRQHEWNIVEFEKTFGKKNTRQKAKDILFLKIFGGGAPAASKKMGVSQDVAREFLRTYDSAFPRIKEYIGETTIEGKRNGCVISSWGRRIRIEPELAYKGVNYRIQGSAADFIKDRMIAVDAFLKKGLADATMVLTIHDELVFEVRKQHADVFFLRALKVVMEDHTGHFEIPMKCTVKRTLEYWDKQEPSIV